MIKRIQIITLLLLIISSFSYGQKDYNGLLWKITKNGASKPSYLYGTMHVSQKLAFHLSDNFYEALESCDVVGLEINPDEWMQQLSETDLLQDNYMLSNFSNLYFNSIKFSSVTDNELASSISDDANIINGLLYRAKGVKEDLEEDTYLDLYIFQTGRRLGKTIVSLESFEDVNELELKANEPLTDAEEKAGKEEKNMYDKKAGKLREQNGSLMDQMETAYRDGNLTLIDTISHILNGRSQFQKYMIDERNRGMAQQMDSIIQSGKQLFTGVGAAHLPGEIGVIDLLVDMGYKVEPMERIIGGKSEKYIKKIDPIIVPVTYVKQTTDDGRISIPVAGTLYDMPSFGKIKTVLYPDMANGVFYWIKRIKTYDYIHKSKSEKSLKKRLETLLYENIPGNIVSQKEIKIGDWTAIDIQNKTRKGDDQHHLLIQTPMEIIIIKMGGKSDYVTKNKSKVFDHLELDYTPSNEWETMTPPEGGFSIELPKLNLFTRMPSGYSEGGSGLEFEAMDASDNYYIARKVIFSDYSFLEKDHFELKILLKNLAKELKYDSISSELFVYNKFPAIKATLQNQDKTRYFHTRIIIQGNNYYILANISKSEKPNNRFFDSFKITKKKYENTFEEYTDSSLLYIARIPKKPDATSQYLGGLYSDYGNYGAKNKDYGIKSKSQNSIIESKYTGESIKIKRRRFHAFKAFENIDSLWSETLSFYTDNKNLTIKDTSTFTKGNLHILDCKLVNDSSSQQIIRRYVQYTNNIYQLSYYTDSISLKSPFCDTVFDSFQPINDTLPTFDIFKDKRELLYTFLDSEDSLKVTKGFYYMFMPKYEKEDEAKIKHYIDNFHSLFKKYDLNIRDKSDLIVLMRRFETPSSVSYLKDLYLKNEDSVSYQIASLKALADIETTQSYEIIKELLIENTPIPKNERDITKIYDRFYDTLELCPKFYPEALFLNQYYEYKEENLILLSTLIDKDILKAKKLKRYKKSLINDANIELKRSMATIETKDLNSSYSYPSSYSSFTDGDKYYSKYFETQLEAYLYIIAPWYKKEEKVRKIYAKIKKVNDIELKLNALISLTNNNIEVPASEWEELAKDELTTYLTFDYMQYYNVIDQIDSLKYFSDTSLIKSAIYNHFDMDKTEDLEFLETRSAALNDSIIDFHFYKKRSVNKYSNNVSWNIVVCKKNTYTNTPNAIYYAIEKGASINEFTTKEEIKEEIDDLILSYQMNEHSRYKKPGIYDRGLY